MAFHEYPYTDFHEMNLDWVIAKVKELTLAWAQTSSDWEELRTFVNDYFANLNVQEEINNKMDELVSDGTLSSLIAPYVESCLPAEVANQIAGVVAQQIGAVVAAQLPAQVAEQIPAAVAGEAANWLSEHVDPSTGYVVDDTLTIAGAAADAKVAGEIRDSVFNDLQPAPLSSDWVNGNISGSATGGIYTETNTRIICNYRYDVSNYRKVKTIVPAGFKIRVLFFVVSGDIVIGSVYNYAVSDYDDALIWHTDSRVMDIPAEAKGILVTLAKTDDSLITPNDIPEGFYFGLICLVNNIESDISELKSAVQYIPTTSYHGKRISILGDSISTFAGNNPESAGDGHTIADGTWTFAGNHCRYPNTYLSNVNDTYWKKIIDFYEMNFGINDSWAGSTVSWNGTESGEQGANKYIASPTRIGHLDDNGTPDFILVNAGTNDIGLNVTIGTFNTEDPKNYTDEQIAALPVATFADAYRALLIRLIKSYPLAKIIVMLPNFTTSYYDPEKADRYLEIIKEECDYFGIPWVDVRTCGFNIWNTGTYTGDGIHPNIAGMELLYKCVAKFMQYEM